MSIPAGFTPITAARIQDAAGNLLSGTLEVLPTDGKDVPMDATAGGVGGPVSKVAAAFSFTTGVLQTNAWVPDTQLTAPVYTSYRFTFKDPQGNIFAIRRGVQPSGASALNLDTLAPNVPAQAPYVPVVGPTGPGGVASLGSLALLRSTTSTSPNVFNSATVSGANTFISPTDGTVHDNTGTVATGLVAVNSGGEMTANVALVNPGSGTAGYAFYDQNGAFHSGVTSAVAAGTPFSVPSGAAFGRFTINSGDVAGAMFVNGTTLPSSFQSFAVLPANVAIQQNAQAALAMIDGVLPQLRNLFDENAATTGNLLQSTNGVAVGASSSYYASGFIPVVAGATYIMAIGLTGGSPFGLAWYDAQQTYLSGVAANFTAGQEFTAPANAQFVRFSGDATQIASQMFIKGTSLPTGYLAFANPTTQQVATQAAAIALSIVNSSLPQGRNLFDKAAASASTLLRSTDGGTESAGSGYYASALIAVLVGATYTMATSLTGGSPYGLAWYDAQFNFLSGVASSFTAGEQFTAPANAAYARFSGDATQIAAQMFVKGTTLPSLYLPFQQPQGTTPVTGDGVWFVGDSYTAAFNNIWQNEFLLRTGMRSVGQDAVSGRTWGEIFEFYSNSPTGTNLGTTTIRTYTGQRNTGTAGNTLAQDLAAANPQLIIIYLGTNDTPKGGTPGSSSGDLGSHGDSTSAGTLYGDILNGITGYINAALTAGISARFLLVAPNFNNEGALTSVQAVGLAMETVAADYAVTVLNMSKRSGVNSLTAATMLRDGLHPTDIVFTTVHGPLIANQVLTMF